LRGHPSQLPECDTDLHNDDDDDDDDDDVQ